MPAGLLDLLYKSVTDTHKCIAICGQCSLQTRNSKGAGAEKWEQARCLGLKRHRISVINPWRLCTSPWSWPSSQLPLATSKAHQRVRISKTIRKAKSIFVVTIHCMLCTIKNVQMCPKSILTFMSVVFKRTLYNVC